MKHPPRHYLPTHNRRWHTLDECSVCHRLLYWQQFATVEPPLCVRCAGLEVLPVELLAVPEENTDWLYSAVLGGERRSYLFDDPTPLWSPIGQAELECEHDEEQEDE